MSNVFEEMGFDPEILGPEETQKRNVREKILRTAKKAARQIPFMDEVLAGYYCMLDPATPAKVRGTALAAFAYFVMPLDLVPDFLLGIGFGDDATVLIATIALLRTHIRDEHMTAARELLEESDS